MKTKERIAESKKLIYQLISKSWGDAIFKEQLIRNPEATITDFIGEQFIVSKDKKLIIEDQTNSDIVYLNIPRKIEYNNLELTDEQLEIVSGGDFLLGIVGGLIANAAYDMVRGFEKEMRR